MMEVKNYWLYLHWLQMLDSADSHGAGDDISVCEEWKTDLQAFVDWAVANGYPGHGQADRKLTLERIDKDRGYEPGNCRWVKKHDR